VVLLAVTFALIGFVALSVLLGNNFGFSSASILRNSTPVARAVPEAMPVGTPNPADVIPFKNAALGFKLEYPRAWRKNEMGLRVVFSPSAAGLEPDSLQDAAIWFGIPADNTTAPADLLARLQRELLSQSQNLSPEQVNLPPSNLDRLTIGAEPWQTTTLNFETGQLGPVTARIATTSKNEVGYYMVAAAPAEQWTAMQPMFQAILNSFAFTTQAVLRPTDATPPPTPTATPTPVFYVVQSGDTLLKIAIQFEVDVDALAARNGIEDPRSLQTGTRLLIPYRRR